MSYNNQKNYLWIVEWNNPFASPGKKKGMLCYHVTPHAGVTQEDFEKFMKHEAIPAIGTVSTRSINFGPQYLLLENAGEGSRDVLEIGLDDVKAAVKKLETLATHTLRYFSATEEE